MKQACWLQSGFSVRIQDPAVHSAELIGLSGLRVGACSSIISMTMCRPSDVITPKPVLKSTGVPTFSLVSAQLAESCTRKDLENMRLSFPDSAPIWLFRNEKRSSTDMFSAGFVAADFGEVFPSVCKGREAAGSGGAGLMIHAAWNLMMSLLVLSCKASFRFIRQQRFVSGLPWGMVSSFRTLVMLTLMRRLFLLLLPSSHMPLLLPSERILDLSLSFT